MKLGSSIISFHTLGACWSWYNSKYSRSKENSSDQEPSSDKKDGDEKVVDADFEEVDDNKKEQGDK